MAPATSDPGGELERALRDERDGRYLDALERLDRVASQGDGATSSVARARALWIRERSEGEFVPLSKLEHVRGSAALSTSRDALVTLLDESKDFPPGRARIESRLFVAAACLREGCAVGSVSGAQSVLADPDSTELDRGIATSVLARALRVEGRDEDAARVITENRRDAPRLAREESTHHAARWMTHVALVILGSIAALAVALLARRRSLQDVMHGASRALLTSLVVTSGGLIAWLFDPSVSTRPFVLLGAGLFVLDRAMLPVALASGTWARRSRRSAHTRIALLGVISAALIGTAAVAVTALAWSDASLLESLLRREPR